jgi:hypothetical protein
MDYETSSCGEHKDHKKERYDTELYADGDKYIGQFMRDRRHGYGIFRWADGEIYYG